MLFLNADLRCLVGRRLDWLMYKLLRDAVEYYKQQHGLKRLGFQTNSKAEQAVTNSLQAAAAIEDASVTISNAVTGSADVSSPNNAAGYMIIGALTAQPCCSWPAGLKGTFCKHLCKVVLMLGKPKLEVLKAWGTLRGTKAGDAIIASWAMPEAAVDAASAAASSTALVAAQQRSVDNQMQWPRQSAMVTSSASERRVDYQQKAEAVMAEIPRVMAGQLPTGSGWEQTYTVLEAALSSVRVLQARSNSAIYASVAQPAALAVNPAAPAGMSRLRLKGATEQYGKSRCRYKSTDERISASQPVAVHAVEGGSFMSQPMLSAPAEIAPVVKRAALQPAGNRGHRKVRCLADQKENLRVKEGEPVLQLEAAQQPTPHDVLQQAAQLPTELMPPDSFLRLMMER